MLTEYLPQHNDARPHSSLGQLTSAQADSRPTERINLAGQSGRRSPRENYYAERFVGTLPRECLNRLLTLGERHRRSILAEHARHYSGHRPQSSTA